MPGACPELTPPTRPDTPEGAQVVAGWSCGVSALDLPPDAYGLIHADLHDGNVNVGPNGELMCFDLDPLRPRLAWL